MDDVFYCGTATARTIKQFNIPKINIVKQLNDILNRVSCVPFPYII